MKIARSTLFFLITALLAQANAADLLQRQSGLWEVRNEMAGKQADCPTMEIKRNPDSILVHSVCQQGTTTVTSDTVITGDFVSSYRAETNIQYKLSNRRMKYIKTTQQARWLGPCQAGQKAGDIMLPGLPTMNINEMARQQPADRL